MYSFRRVKSYYSRKPKGNAHIQPIYTYNVFNPYQSGVEKK